MKQWMKRYRLFLILAAVNLVVLAARPETGVRALSLTGENLLEMLTFLPPIFVLLGLLDVWVEREAMMKYMGAGSGLRGTALAFLLGSAAAGPLYAAFPVAVVLLKKGAGLFQVFVFVGAWSATKIPPLLFEISSLGLSFAAVRLALNLLGIPLIALVLTKSLSDEEHRDIYRRAEEQ